MGSRNHLHVAFACTDNDPVAAIARRHLETPPDHIEAMQFLEHVASLSGKNPGNYGGMVAWGVMGKNSWGESFAEALRGFWLDVLRADGGSASSSAHIMVFDQQEGNSKATAYEIYLDPDADDAQSAELCIMAKDCPFSWFPW